MVATFLVGAAFGWQHIRLCAGDGQGGYYPALGERATHPANEARLRGVLAVLERMGAATIGARVEQAWQDYMAARREVRPPDYEVCYPQALIDSLAERVVTGCQSLGLVGFPMPGERSDEIP